MPVHVAGTMMVKNETKRLRVTLNSLTGFVNSLVIYDTGSTDDTIEILEKYAEETGIELHLKEGEFVNFSESRNVLLEFADTFPEIDYLLLMDTNDELRGGEKLIKFCREVKELPSTGFMMTQQWYSGTMTKYRNIRLVKPREGWRFFGTVHEYIKDTKHPEGAEPPTGSGPDDVVIFQDRTQDDDKSSKRFHRDKVLLLEDYKKNKKDPRTLFYLAQTCSCLHEWDNALYYYRLRTQVEGFQEEKFHAFLRAAEACEAMNMDWADTMGWYMRAFKHSQRAEPLVKIAKYYKWEADETQKTINEMMERGEDPGQRFFSVQNLWKMSYMFIRMACEMEYPNYCDLFVDKHVYDYERWHLMGIIAYYSGNLEDGKNACRKAIAVNGEHREVDESNLNAYFQREKENNITKKDFCAEVLPSIFKEYPNFTIKQAESKANRLWKNYVKGKKKE